MKKIIYIMLLATSTIFSQQENLENQFKLEFNFLGIGASYELPISEKLLLDFGAGVGGGVDAEDGYVWEFDSALAGYLKSELKYYYNLEKRKKTGKTIKNNSGNYIALQTKYFSRRFKTEEFIEPLTNSLLTEFHWGLQRSLGDDWLFNFHLGFGVLRKLDENRGLLSPSLGVKFSYKLF